MSNEFDEAVVNYAAQHGISQRTAIRHAALRRVLAEAGGMVNDLGAMRLSIEQKCGFEISREEVERDLEFLKRLAQREAADRE